MTHTAEPRAGSPRPSSAMAGGVTIFAAVMLIVAGVLDILRGIMAIAEDDIFVATSDYIFQFDLTGWGWLHLILGALAVLVGFGLFGMALWARTAAVFIAGVLIIGNFLSIPYFPVWSLVAIALYAWIIWAVCTVGDHAG
ncbi:DUF7144 family membrane protein [Streptomyces aidingensis]|uniref:DUF7144 domain-containing protein n=1 Tax=Streptomyces aidingensis TaxID=910347 RepID=A0A1I1LPM5_9ACTN|nr:hypothetical protein [Streptomyces aidingensis]SFC74502.1 hypothetical protein SAMN05421773_105317 [Streptomyces aidingensis]